jgi:hypothetical protein
MRETRLDGGVNATLVFAMMGEEEGDIVSGVGADNTGDFEDEDEERDLEAIIICWSN